MEKENKIITLIIFIIVSLILFVILLDRHREKNINTYEFPSSLSVKNYTDLKRADTVSMIILNKIFKYDSINLNIYYLQKEMKNDEIEIFGYIQNDPKPYNYSIFLKRGINKYQVMKFLSHELIHLDQMERGDLITQTNNYKFAIYCGDTIKFNEVEYMKRPYEIEAHAKDNDIYKKLISLLYKK